MSFDILVVDDSKAALFMFKKILTLSGAPVKSILTAENGKLAIDVLKQNHIDLIMTDINMPEMDGFQLLEYLKKSDAFRHIPVIVITTEGRGKYIEKATRLGAANYLRKPFQPEQVKALLLNTLGIEAESSAEELEGEDF